MSRFAALVDVGDAARMSRVVLIELEPDLARRLTTSLEALGYEVASIDALDAMQRLVTDGPELAIVNLELTQGSGFSLVNRVRRNEALSAMKIVLVAEKATEAALDAHRRGPTPARAYVRRTEMMSNDDVAAAVLDESKRALAEHLPEIAYGDLVTIDGPDRSESALAKRPASFEAIIAELGSYRVLRRLRDEDAGAVFKCRDEDLRRDVVIKLMRLDGNDAERDERSKRFQREGRILALLSSPFVIAVYGAGARHGVPYLVRELLDGETLADQVAREGPLDEKTALARVKEIALGLQHAAAADVIHRDVRPDNIRVVDGRAKIARFAMGKRIDDPRITLGGVSPGDLSYVAPERTQGKEDLRGDIYSLGVTWHTLLAGKPPWPISPCLDLVRGKLVVPPVALDVARPGVNGKAAALVARMLSEDPARRPQTYDELHALLDDAANALTSTPHPAGATTQSVEPSAVFGTLRLMSVIEIVQSLELSRRTATVLLPMETGGDGRLAFDAGRLIHASVGAQHGEDAFFTLVAKKNGVFRLDYDAPSLANNISTPVTALLLEAARRADVDAASDSGASTSDANLAAAAIPPTTSTSSTPASAATTSSWSLSLPGTAEAHGADDNAVAGGGEPDFTLGPRGGEAHAMSDSAPLAATTTGARAAREHDVDLERDIDLALNRSRRVHPVLGFLAIGVVGAVCTAAGFHLPLLTAPGDAVVVDEDYASPALAVLLAKQRTQARDAKLALAAAAPKLAALEAAQASSASASEDAKKRASDAHDALVNALQPLQADIDAKRLTLRASDDGDAVIEINESALFAADAEDLSGDGKALLARVAPALQKTNASVRVEGHTDDVEPKNKSKNNWGVSGARATAVAKQLSQQGVSRVKAVALADTMPVASNRNAKGRARNRRVELHLIRSSDADTPGPGR
jgi:serine/threonine protein kinase/flagellar motor protein MotB/ActR/RegA family two-component response regulator